MNKKTFSLPDAPRSDWETFLWVYFEPSQLKKYGGSLSKKESRRIFLRVYAKYILPLCLLAYIVVGLFVVGFDLPAKYPAVFFKNIIDDWQGGFSSKLWFWYSKTFFGLVFGLILGLATGTSKNLARDLTFGLTFGLTVGLFVSALELAVGLAFGLTVGLAVGCGLGVILGFLIGFIAGLLYYLLVGFGGSLSYGLLVGLGYYNMTAKFLVAVHYLTEIIL
jgi:hypothetical protein